MSTILRGDLSESKTKKTEDFFDRQVVDNTVPRSYVALMTVATAFGLEFKNDIEVIRKLDRGWNPYCCNGIPLGVAIWDCWAKDEMHVLDDSE